MNSYQQQQRQYTSSSGGGGNSMSYQQMQHQQQQIKKQLKRKLSFVLRDKDEIPHRKGVNSILVDNQNMPNGQSLLFTASRDRLIKLWHVDYKKKQYNLRANLDEHTDWVNQILYNQNHKMLFSCSNDTTIKLWSLDQTLKNIHTTLNLIKQSLINPQRLNSVMTLNDDSDYVRAIDYSEYKNMLYSVSDNGIVRLWDINLGKVVQAINLKGDLSQTERALDKSYLTQNKSIELLKIDHAIPTCVSCSQGGSVVAIGFTDEVIRVVDIRIKNQDKSQFELRGDGHTDIVKQVQLSPEGMVCLSAGSDCSFKVWDLSTRKCIKTYGGDSSFSGGVSRKHSTYHKDTLTSLDVLFEQDFVFSGGRDGTIFGNRIVKNQHNQIYQDSRKIMINSLKYDEINQSLWYSTPDSDIQCLRYLNELILNEDEPYMREQDEPWVAPQLQIKGLPQITEYHVLKNKRYILTNSTDPQVKAQLWSLDTGKVIKSWTTYGDENEQKFENYESVKQYVNDCFDIGGVNSPVKKSDVIPLAWFTCDIKLGSLTIHLDEDNWLKGNVIDNDTNVERFLDSVNASKNKKSLNEEESLDFNRKRDIKLQQSQTEMQKALNLGFNLTESLFKLVQTRFTEAEQRTIKSYLGSNYKDYVRLKSMMLDQKEEERKQTYPDAQEQDNDIQCMPIFAFLMEAESQKPIWTSYADDPRMVEKLVHYLPSSMRKHIQFSIPNLETSNKISLGVNTVHVLDLPKFQEGKRLTCNPTTPIFDLITFLSDKLEFQKQFLMPQNEFDPLQFVEITLPVKYPRPKIPASQLTEQQLEQLSKPYDELIPLDKTLTLVIIQKLLLPYSGMHLLPTIQGQSNLMSSSMQTPSNNQMNLLYRKRPIDYSQKKKKQQNSGSKDPAPGDTDAIVNTNENSNGDEHSTNAATELETFRNINQTPNTTTSTVTPQKQQNNSTKSKDNNSSGSQKQIRRGNKDRQD